MNLVVEIGRLTKDADVRYASNDDRTCIARFVLAVDRKFKKDGEQSADFINCVAFGKTAEFIEKYVGKGTKIAVTGHIQTGSYDNKDGQKVYTTEVVADSVEFAESKGKEESKEEAKEEKADMGFVNVPDDAQIDLPFAQPVR